MYCNICVGSVGPVAWNCLVELLSRLDAIFFGLKFRLLVKQIIGVASGAVLALNLEIC
jgi:hypothetical protein